MALPDEVRALLDAPNYVHLATLGPGGRPRSWVVWVGVDGEDVLVCTDDRNGKARDMRRDPRVALSVVDRDDPYRMATIAGRVREVRPDPDCGWMDPIAVKYTSAPFPHRGPERVCFVVAVERADHRRLRFVDRPAAR